MADAIEVFAFNVRFGDAILVRVPDKNRTGGGTTVRHILIDVGNTLAAAKPKNEPMPGEPGGADDVLPPAVEKILEVLNGAKIDFYVMTHEHLDHVQGLPYADRKRKLTVPKLHDLLQPKFVWMTASAEGDAYYNRHENARRENEKKKNTFDAIQAHLWAGAGTGLASLAPLLINNNPLFTGPCVDWLKALAPAGSTPAYLHREVSPEKLAVSHPFQEATFKIWAPEEDTSTYYGKIKPMALGEAAPVVGDLRSANPRLLPPPGVDAEAFLNLVDMRRRGVVENLLAIDKAANNTSLVFCLEWRGRKLLFAGDAEEKSWAMMKSKGVLEPVDFLKVSHHGSINGTPDLEILDIVLPIGVPASQKAKRIALISSWDHTYGGIPHEPTNAKLRARCGKLISTLDDRNKPFVTVQIPAA
jgi:beta-lactamase superfamily II metal-dependent hydrolase